MRLCRRVGESFSCLRRMMPEEPGSPSGKGFSTSRLRFYRTEQMSWTKCPVRLSRWLPSPLGLVVAITVSAEFISATAQEPRRAKPAVEETQYAAGRSTPVRPEQFLTQTEPFLRPPRVGELETAARQLWSFGYDRLAKRLAPPAKASATDYERLARQLLRLGKLPAAGELLDAWLREEPRNPTAHLLRAITHQAGGDIELAWRVQAGLRDARMRLRDPFPDHLRALADLQLQLLEMQRRDGKQPGLDANPWNVSFTDATGRYVAGRIAEAQACRIPEGTAEAMMQLVALVPKQGNLWALLGELLNADGNPTAALECLRRASEVLLYTPDSMGLLMRRRAVLERYQRQARRAADEAMEQAVAAKTVPGKTQPIALDDPSDASGDLAVNAGWLNLAARPRILVVILLGLGFAFWIVILQLREWCRGGRR